MSKNQKVSNAESKKPKKEESQNMETNLESNTPKFPVSLEFFKKWTHYEEIIELTLRKASCGDEDEYQKLKAMPKFAENAIRNYYTFFYLKPKIREKYPIRIKPMPKHVKEKLLQIPNNTKSKLSSKSLFANKRKRLAEESSNGDFNNNVTSTETKTGKDKQTKSGNEVSNHFDKVNSLSDGDVESSDPEHARKEAIILPPTNLDATQSRNCDFEVNDCIFCHFPLSDFKKSTNVIELIKQTIFHSIQIDDPNLICDEIRAFYIKYLLRILSPDEAANLSMSLHKYELLSKYHEICNECKVQYNVEKAGDTYIIDASFTEKKYPLRSVNTTDDNRDEDNLRSYSSYCNPCDDNDQAKQSRTRFIDVLKHDLHERLSRNWNRNDYIPIDYNTFKKRISYREPLQQIIKFIASSDEILSKEILQDAELYDLILKEFYLNYFTNEEICEKYPLTFNALKLSPGRQQTPTKSNTAENANNNMESSNRVSGTYYSAVFSNKFLLSYISRKCQDPVKQQTILNQIKASFPSLTRTSINSTPTELSNITTETDTKEKTTKKTSSHLKLSKANKNQSLGYMQLTSHGFKYQVVKEILSLSFEEFQNLTSIYESDELKTNIVSMHIYRLVIVQKYIWPINLFINLKKLLTYLVSRNVKFAISDNPLDHIPPIILHWSDLIQTTNFESCVSVDYLKCTGKTLNTDDAELLKNRCDSYYRRCSKHNMWIWQTPKIINTHMEEINQELIRSGFKPISSTSFEVSTAAEKTISPPMVIATSERSINSELLPTSTTSTVSTLPSPASPVSSEATSSTTETANENNDRKSVEVIDNQRPVILEILTIRKKNKKVNSCVTHNTKGKSDLVPQLSHNFRPLPLQLAEISPNNLQNEFTSEKPANTMPETNNEIQISQELSTNCSIFNNINAGTPSKLAFEKEHSKSNSAGSVPDLQNVNDVKSKEVIQNKCFDTATDSLKSNFAQTSKPAPHVEHAKNHQKKIILYRHLVQMDFFQALNAQHIIKYEIPTINIGSRHIQAVIKFDNIKIRLNNKSLLALFPTWPRKIKWHLLAILNNIKEYHYTYNPNQTFEDVEDLKVRMLHWLFQTAPKFSLVVLNYPPGNPELANCENINYSSKTLSHSSLSKAISPRILANISKHKLMNSHHEKEHVN